AFLSSMFHSLNFRDDRRSYFLDTSPQQRLKLSDTYRQFSDPLEPWPSGTRVAETTEYLFDCIASGDLNVNHHVLTISYLDYAGEIFENEQETGPQALQKLADHINSAQALLCVIDGHRILQLLKNEPAGHNHFQFTMQTMIGMMQSASCPIHLVITKWDIVRGFGEPADADEELRLGLVIDALMAFDHIRSLVYLRGAHQITRVIPVSALGTSFVRIDTNGKMVKRNDGKVRPINVGVPLCAVLPDLFKQIQSSLDEETRKNLDTEIHKGIRMRPHEIISGVADFLKRPTGIIVSTALFATIGRNLGNEATAMFLDWAAQPYQKKAAKISAERRGAELQFERFQQARAGVMEDFMKAVLRLEVLFPNSQLRRR
ncbi:MAG: hypothetical protein ACRDTC_10125, partial [Pseudonocardiaceae bacterium]